MKSRHLICAAIVVAVSAAFLAVLTHLAKFALGTPIGTYILLVPPLCVALLWESHSATFSKVAFHWKLGSVFFAASLLVAVLAGNWSTVSDSRLSLQTLSLVLAWLGAFAACYGPQAMARARLPLFFLLLTIPPTPFITNSLVHGLQYASTILTELLFRLSGVPCHREGFLFILPGISLEVAEECSGIGSTMFLLLMSTVVSYFYLRRWWSRLLFVALIFPISTTKNALRIFSIGIVGSYIDPMVLESKLHQYGGPIFFVFSLAMLYLSLCLFTWIETTVRRRQTMCLSTQSFATTANIRER